VDLVSIVICKFHLGPFTDFDDIVWLSFFYSSFRRYSYFVHIVSILWLIVEIQQFIFSGSG